MTTTDHINHDVFAGWAQRFPDRAAASPDPRYDGPCYGPECQTFAWHGYDGLCGWCFEVSTGGHLSLVR